MSTSQRTEPGTSVARTDNAASADRALAGLDAEGRRQVLEQRMRRANLQAVANESWGSALSPNAQRAVAAYMVRFNLDVGEVEILGGKIYRNGQYYKRRIAEMRTRGMVEWSMGDHIGPDARLDKLAEDGDAWAKEESTRRLRERIRWSVPEDATHAYVSRVKVKGDENPLEGCDWITPKRMKQTKYGPKLADPVGADEPEKTVITRAWRRVGLIAAAEIPELRQQEEVMDAGAVEVSEEVERIGTEEGARDVSARRPRELMPATRPDAPYEPDPDAPGNTREAVTVTPTPRTEAHADAARTAASIRDPYDERDEGAPTEETAAPTAPTRAPAGYVMKFGGDFVGKLISEVPKDELVRLLAWAEKRKDQGEFIEAAKIELDDRRFDEQATTTQATGDGR
jgi:hypothetical protein